MCEMILDNNEDPKLYINSIKFNDNTELTLNHNSIVIFTGGNNCGKSQVLKDIENGAKKNNKEELVTITDIDYQYTGNMNEHFIDNRFVKDDQGNYIIPEPSPISYSYLKDGIIGHWDSRSLVNDLNHVFIKRLNTEYRITTSNPLIRNQNPERNPIYKLNKNNNLVNKISELFHQAFGVDLVINKNEISSIPIHIGNAPKQDKYLMNEQDKYYSEVNKMPQLQDQGDGMRSFASILLDTFTSDFSITLIDEPEAFLHPPQARILGKMLAENNPSNRQLFISTHSADFLQGLLDADSDNITVIRMNRKEKINKISILPNDKIKELWTNPLLRYSNILNGLFHEKIIVCESDYDCLLYQAVLNAMVDNKGDIVPDILYTHCGGKYRIKDAINALRIINVPVIAICDFDTINNKNVFKPLIMSFGLNWETQFESDMKIFYDTINSNSSAKESIKKSGKNVLTNDAPAAFDRINKVCRNAGLFIVPVGEIESFDKTINKQKKEWVYSVLNDYNLATEEKLSELRAFIQAIYVFKP